MKTVSHPRRRTFTAWWACLVASLSAPAFAIAATPAERTAQDRVLAQINAVRTARHLPALRPSAVLSGPARRQADFLARTGRLQHESADGSPFFERLYRAGFSRRKPVGENIGIASSCSTGLASRIVRMWLGSPPHRRMLLSRRFHVVGVGVVAAADCSNTAFTADFGG